MTVTLIDVITNPYAVVAIIIFALLALFIYFCIYERDDIKKVFEKIEAGLTAVWTVIKNPLNLVGFITVSILVNAFPHLLKDISGAT